MILIRSFLVFFYEGYNMSMKEIELILREVKVQVKKENFITFENILQEVYENLDNSPAIKNKIEIEKSIYVYKDFEMNRKVKLNEERLRVKKKSKDFGRNRFHASKMLHFGIGNHLLSIQRRSRTVDLSAIMMIKSTLRNSIPSQQSDLEKQNKLSKVFFLINFFQLEKDFEDKEEFSKFFLDFYYQIKKDFKEFVVRAACK